MSNELSNNGEFKQDYEWEDVIPDQKIGVKSYVTLKRLLIQFKLKNCF